MRKDEVKKRKRATTCVKTFVYKGLGIPIKLVNVPMKKAAGVWCLDINMNSLMRVVLESVVHKKSALNGDELKYIRKQLGMTTEEFGKTCSVTPLTVLKWESNQNKISPPLDLYIRLYVLSYLDVKDKEFKRFYNEIDLEDLSKLVTKKQTPTIKATENKLVMVN